MPGTVAFGVVVLPDVAGGIVCARKRGKVKNATLPATIRTASPVSSMIIFLEGLKRAFLGTATGGGGAVGLGVDATVLSIAGRRGFERMVGTNSSSFCACWY